MRDFESGKPIAICNGGNDGHCVEADDVVKHRLRRPGRAAGPGDPDYVDDSPKKVQLDSETLATEVKYPHPKVEAMPASPEAASAGTIKAEG